MGPEALSCKEQSVFIATFGDMYTVKLMNGYGILTRERDNREVHLNQALD